MTDEVKPEPVPLPAGIENAYRFQVFNSLSFSLIIGTPILLFFKKLDASVTVLGIVAALPPLLNVMQIPAARFVEQVGYRTFVLRGWTIRSVFIAGAAGVAILPDFVDAQTRMMLMLFLIFCYNLSRGISVCGFLPWISQLVPEERRGHFLSRDQMCGFTSITVGALLCGLYLQSNSRLDAFGLVFFLSFVAAMVSLYFLKRMPDVEIPDEARRSSREPVPWKRMLTFRPFTRFLVFNVVMLLGWSGGGVMVVPLLRDYHGVSDSLFMYLNAAWGLVFVLALWGLGKVSDWAGSKPVLNSSLIIQIFHYAGWGAIASGWIPFNFWTLAFQQISWGLAFALFNVSNTRLVMSIVPQMGRSHFFALFSVGTSLTAGLAPVFWGLSADALTNWKVAWGGFEWNAYSLLYTGVVGWIVLAIVCLKGVEEPRALTNRQFFRELAERTPVRAIPRLFHRRFWP